MLMVRPFTIYTNTTKRGTHNNVMSEIFSLDLREHAIPAALGRIVDIAPIPDRPCTWLLLGEDDRITCLDLATGTSAHLAAAMFSAKLDHEASDEPTPKRRLHVSHDGRFAAVVNDYGRHGQILDLSSEKVTVHLECDDYYPDLVPFSFAFLRFQGRPAAVHRTEWNRLDITDVATGELLTPRSPTGYGQGEDRPAHYLDYFHGALHLNPDGTRIANDGWVWHPVGVVTVWDLASWESNPWESEDGPSKRDLCVREYYWNVAMAWISHERIAVQGIGDDEDEMVDGARIFDVTWVEDVEHHGYRRRTAREVFCIHAPRGVFLCDGAYLFSSHTSGLSRWDLGSRECTGQLPEFNPTHRHHGSGEFVQLRDRVLVVSSAMSGAAA